MSQMPGMARAAVSRRVRSTSNSSRPGNARAAVADRPGAGACHSVDGAQPLAVDLLRCSTEASLALLEIGERLEVLTLAEIRPQRVGDVDLGVGELPEEEVADAHLAAGPDEQVRIGDALGGEMVLDRAGVDLVGLELAAPHAARDGARRPRDLLAPAVAHRQDHGHAGVALGRLDGGA